MPTIITQLTFEQLSQLKRIALEIVNAGGVFTTDALNSAYIQAAGQILGGA